MQNQAKYNAVLHAAHLLLKAMPQAAEQYGMLLNKTPNSVRNELNPNLPGHKLGVLEALEMMNYSQAYGLLYQMCAACGFVAVPMAAGTGKRSSPNRCALPLAKFGRWCLPNHL